MLRRWLNLELSVYFPGLSVRGGFRTGGGVQEVSLGLGQGRAGDAQGKDKNSDNTIQRHTTSKQRTVVVAGTGELTGIASLRSLSRIFGRSHIVVRKYHRRF